jgi:(S)-mandelate dehydrogenase
MKLDGVVNIEDLHRVAKRRVAKAAFDYYEGGVEDEVGLVRNERAFRQHRLLPRYLVDVSQANQTATLFGHTYASPFGIGPTALGGLLRTGADSMLAQAAAEANIPYVLSGLSTTRLEDVARTAPQHAWFQLYGARDRRISEDMIRRAADAGMGALLFTVDVPIVSKREREIRNRFGQRMPLGAYIEALRHPAWLLGYLRHGRPVFENWVPYCDPGASLDTVIHLLRAQFPVDDHTWKDVENFRRLWPRTFVLKGILHPDDAVRAAELGVDGIVVSNHGARQLDAGPTALEALPAIRAAVGDRLTVMVDGGVRRGADVVIACALGARFVWVGRATQYGVAAFGLPGARKAVAILQNEIQLTLKQIGCTSLERLGPEFLMPGGDVNA